MKMKVIITSVLSVLIGIRCLKTIHWAMVKSSAAAIKAKLLVTDEKINNDISWNLINVTGEDKYDFNALDCYKLIWEPGDNNNKKNTKKNAIAIAVTQMDINYIFDVERQVKRIRQMSDLDIVVIVLKTGTTRDITKMLESLTEKINGVYVLSTDLGFKTSDLGKHFVRYQNINRNCCGIGEYVKLEAFSLNYDQVLFLDVDVTLVKSPEVLFHCDADLMYAAGPFSPLNGGMFVLKPNKRLYSHMIQTLKRVSHTYTQELCYEGLGCGPCKKLDNQSPYCVGKEGPQGFLHYYFVKRGNVRLTVHQISSCVFDYQNDRHHICPIEFPHVAHTYPYIIHKDEGLSDFFSHEPLIINAPGEKVCRPDFWILGTRKGGTTNLYTLMAQHPQVASFNIAGEPQDGEVMGSVHKLKDYNSNFKKVRPDLLVGDSTVGRLVKDARSITETCGHKHTKFVILLRDPIERCHSQMLMRARLRTNNMNMNTNISQTIFEHLKKFQKATDNNIKWAKSIYPTDKIDKLNCINAGIYVAQLKRWFYHASISNIRIYFTETFHNHTQEVIQDALQFVGVPSTEIQNFKLDLRRGNSNARPTLELPIHQQLTTTLRQEMELTFAPYNAMLKDLLKVDLPWQS